MPTVQLPTDGTLPARQPTIAFCATRSPSQSAAVSKRSTTAELRRVLGNHHHRRDNRRPNPLSSTRPVLCGLSGERSRL